MGEILLKLEKEKSKNKNPIHIEVNRQINISIDNGEPDEAGEVNDAQAEGMGNEQGGAMLQQEQQRQEINQHNEFNLQGNIVQGNFEIENRKNIGEQHQQQINQQGQLGQ